MLHSKGNKKNGTVNKPTYVNLLNTKFEIILVLTTFSLICRLATTFLERSNARW